MLVYRRRDMDQLGLPRPEPPRHLVEEVCSAAAASAAAGRGPAQNLTLFITALQPSLPSSTKPLTVSSDITTVALLSQIATLTGIPEDFLTAFIITDKGLTNLPSEAISISDCGLEDKSEICVENLTDTDGQPDHALSHLEYLKRQDLMQVFVEDVASPEKERQTLCLNISRSATILELKNMVQS